MSRARIPNEAQLILLVYRKPSLPLGFVVPDLWIPESPVLIPGFQWREAVLKTKS